MPPEGQESLIFIDDLTGLYNRRYLYAQLPKELEQAQVNKSKLWLFMLDIDNFKMINDTYGHLSGDDLIKDLAKVLKENTKTEDVRIRYAGDEFTIILPNIEAKDVVSIANRLVAKIDGHRFKEKHSGKEIHATISVGIAGYPQDTSEPIELINLADKALYISKQKGRNCVSVVSEITPELFWKKGLLERFPCPVLVERENELRKLNEALRQATQSATSLYLITGELGIGKSRLLNEFESSLKDQDVVDFSIRCEEKFLNQPFYALGDPLDRYLASLDEMPSEFLENIPDVELAALAGYLPSLKDIIKAQAPQDEEDHLSPGLIKLLLNISRYKPSCLIFDDFHYIDEKSLKVLIKLIQENRDACIMVVGAFSQDELESPDMGESPLAKVIKAREFRDHALALGLSALGPRGVNEIISNILLNIPLFADFSELIYKKSKGNPLFVEELLKYLIEKEIICYKDGRWLQKGIDEQSLPSSIEEAIKSRLEDLDEETKEMIAKAAVIGDDFQVDLLQKIDSEDRGYVLDLIEAGKKIGLIYEKGTKGKDEFGFVTSEIRNILFKAIGGERTKHFYSRLGQIKEQLHPDNLNSIAGELYYNFKKAEDQVRAEQYAKIVKEGKGVLYDRTIQYAQSLLEEAVQEKMLTPLSKKTWMFIPGLIRSICMSMVNYVLYPAQNKMRIQSIEEVYKKLSDIFVETEILNIAIVESNIIANNKKIGKELTSFFTESFLTALKNLSIESITFHAGIELSEVNAFIGLVSLTEPPEEPIPELLQKQNVTHIQINEVTYDISKKKTREKESLEEIMLIDYLLGKLPSAGENKGDLAQNISTHAQEIAQALEKMGEEASQKTGKDKESAKAEIMAKSIQKIGKQFLEKGEDWSKYKEGLAKTILSMEPQLRANIFSAQPEPEGKEKERVDVMKELSLELPEDVITDVLTSQYVQKDTDISKMKSLVHRFLSTPDKKAKLAPVLKEKLKQLGATDEECNWIFEDKLWERLSLEDKAKMIIQSPAKVLLKILPLIKVNPFIRELLTSGQEAQVEAIEDKFIKLWQEKAIPTEACANYLKDAINILIHDYPDNLLPKFIIKLLKISAEKPEFSPIFFLCLNPYIDRITNILMQAGKVSLMKDIMEAYVKSPENAANLSRAIEPIAIKLVEELIRRIDLNLDWAELVDSLILFKNQATRLLIDRALFEKGVPEGKYFEAYLRRRTIGKVLSHIPKEDLLAVMTKEKFSDSPPYLIRNLIEIIGAMENENAVIILEIPLANPDMAIRRKVIFTLSKMRGETSAKLLGQAIRDKDINLAKEALYVLKNRKDSFSENALKEAAQDKDLLDDIRKNI